MNTQENNKLIAEFMVRDKEVDFHTTEEIKEGFREEATWYALDGWVKDDELQYHKSWDWLMPVVDKMNTTELWDEYDISYLATYLVSVDINATYNAVVEFINQYNKNESID